MFLLALTSYIAFQISPYYRGHSQEFAPIMDGFRTSSVTFYPLVTLLLCRTST